MSSVVLFVVAPFLVFTGTLQIVTALLTGDAYYMPLRFTSPGPFSLANDPILFGCAIMQAAIFIAWGGWILARERK